jgi:hypothetical protein
VGIDSLQNELGCRIPVIITIDVPGLLLFTHRVEQVWSLVARYSPVAMDIASYGSGADDLRRLRDVSDVAMVCCSTRARQEQAIPSSLSHGRWTFSNHCG